MVEHSILVQTQATTLNIFYNGTVVVIDRKTGKVIKVVPGHPILDSAIASIESSHALLSDAKKMKMPEILQTEIAKYLISLTDTIAASVTEKSS